MFSHSLLVLILATAQNMLLAVAVISGLLADIVSLEVDTFLHQTDILMKKSVISTKNQTAKTFFYTVYFLPTF